MDSGTSDTLKEIQDIFAAQKTEAYLVGGALRDVLLGRAIRDFDFAVPKDPRRIAGKVADHFQWPLVTLEEEEEIYRVVSKEGVQFDFAKFKGPDIRADLSLRDFSINAMAVKLPIGDLNPQSADVIDPYSGREDLRKKNLRQISPEIYNGDPLRLLRAFRIAAQLEFSIDPQTGTDIRENRGKIRGTAAERVREEVLLLLESPRAYPYVCELDGSGLISEIFPEVDANRQCALSYYPGKGVWGHSLDGLKNLEWIFGHLPEEFGENHEKISAIVFSKGDETEGRLRCALLKLSILLHDVGKASTAQEIEGRLRFFQHEYAGAKLAKKIGERLKFSHHAVQGLSGLVQWHMRPGGLAHIPDLTDRARYRFFRDLGPLAVPMLLVSLADRYTYLADEERGQGRDLHEKSTKELLRWYYQKELEQKSKKPRLVNGHVLMEKLGLPAGPRLGALLKDLDEAVALEEVKTVEEALEFARRWPGGRSQVD